MTKTVPFDLGHYSAGLRRSAFPLQACFFFAAGRHFCYSILAFIRKKPVT